MMDVSEAPSAIRDLLTWLLGRGFQVSEARVCDPVNQDVVFVSGDRTVRIHATSGDWVLGIGLYGETFHPEQWEAWLDGAPLAGDLDDLYHQVAFIAYRWQAAIERFREHPDAGREIRAIGDEWAWRRFGPLLPVALITK